MKGYADENSIAAYAEAVYAKPNIALVGDGATTTALSKWTEQFFKSVPSSSSGSSTLSSKASTYYGGEHRIAHKAGNSMVIAFPGSSFSSFKPEVAVLAALLGGQPSVKWAPGFTLLAKAAAGSPGAAASATNLAYSDAGLLAIQIAGSAASVKSAAEAAVKALKSVSESISKEDLTKAIAKAKFDTLVASESGINTLLAAGSGIIHTGKPFQIAETIKSIEGVTAEKLKTVSTFDAWNTWPFAYNLYRLPSLSSMGRPLLQRLVICSHCHTLRSLASRSKRGMGNGSVSTIQLTVVKSRLVPVHIVNPLEFSTIEMPRLLQCEIRNFCLLNWSSVQDALHTSKAKIIQNYEQKENGQFTCLQISQGWFRKVELLGMN